MENDKTVVYRPEFLTETMEIGKEILDESVGSVLKVYDTSEIGLTLSVDSLSREVICAKTLTK